MSENSVLKHTIIGTVVGGIILAAIQWGTGFVTLVLRWLWLQLKTEVVFDGWLLILAGIFLIIYVFVTTRRIVWLTSEVNRYEGVLAEQRNAAGTLNLGEDELEALKQHADLLPNYGVTASSLAEDLTVHNQKAQYLLDSLTEKRLVEYAFKADNGEDAY
ncbi:MAG: hypothetical protein ACK5Q1_19100 [Limnobacter sp.]